MRAIMIEPTTNGTALKLGNIAEPTLGPAQLRIRVRAASVNRADLAQRAGAYGPGPGTAVAPVVAGLDAAGDVLEIGERVEGVLPGDRVMTLVDGGLAEQVVVDAGLAVSIPGDWSYVEGAAAILGLLTEHNALRTVGRLQPGETVLIHAAASGVGLVGVRLAKHFGVGRIIATTRSGRGRELLLSLGVDHVVQPRQGSFAADVLKAAGEPGVNVILDHVGGPYLEALAFKRVQITGVTFRTRTMQEKIDVARTLRADLDLDEAATELRPVVDTVAPWDRVEQLQARMVAGHHLGKMVLEVPTTTS
jgi:NADPH:quinone reductase-like Zn-dependent oxidoreductase